MNYRFLALMGLLGTTLFISAAVPANAAPASSWRSISECGWEPSPVFGLPLSEVATETLNDGNQIPSTILRAAHFAPYPENAELYNALLGRLRSERSK